MALLIHLRVLSVGRLRVTAVVTIWTVVRIAVGGGILSHALRKTWTLRAVLRSSAVARGCRLVPDGRELGVLGRLSGDADCLSHLSVNRRLRSASLVSALLHVGPVSLFVGFARGLLLLLLRFPLLSNFLEFCKNKLACYIIGVKTPRQVGMGRQVLASVIRSYPVQRGHDHYGAAPAPSQRLN